MVAESLSQVDAIIHVAYLTDVASATQNGAFRVSTPFAEGSSGWYDSKNVMAEFGSRQSVLFVGQVQDGALWAVSDDGTTIDVSPLGLDDQAGDDGSWRIVRYDEQPCALRVDRRADGTRHLSLLALDLVPTALGDADTLVASANREVEAFSYSISHDLRGPLRSILFGASVLNEDYGDKLDEEAKQSLERISAGAKKIASLVDDVLRVSRLSRIEPQLADIDLAAVVTKVGSEIVAKENQEAKLVVSTRQTVRTDQTLLTVVLEQLISNAARFSVGSDNPEIEVGIDQHGCFVRDHGIGIEAKDKGRVFKPFEKLVESQGSGIGLALASRAVARLGGRIWVESVPGAGSTFRFTLG